MTQQKITLALLVTLSVSLSTPAHAFFCAKKMFGKSHKRPMVNYVPYYYYYPAQSVAYGNTQPPVRSPYAPAVNRLPVIAPVSGKSSRFCPF